MTAITWPATADDGGDGLTGTELNAAYFALVKAAIDLLIHSTTNPTVTPEDIIDEVVDARGTELDLATRLLVALNLDGTLKTQAGLATNANIQASQQKNLMPDARLQMWPDGVGAGVEPWGWTINGAGATCIRNAAAMDWSSNGVDLTRAGAAVRLRRTLLAGADFPDGLQGKVVTVAMRCATGTGGAAGCAIYDGAGEQIGGPTGNDTTHSGDGVETWVYATRTLDAAASELSVDMIVRNNDGTATFGAIVLCLGSFTPTVWLPDRWGIMPVPLQIRGAAAADTPVNAFELPVPVACMMNQTMLHAQTAPTVTDLIYQPQKATVAVYATDPEIAATATDNLTAGEGEACDGATEDLRCFNKGDILEVDCTQVDGGGTGADIMIQMLFDVPLGDLDVLGL